MMTILPSDSILSSPRTLLVGEIVLAALVAWWGFALVRTVVARAEPGLGRVGAVLWIVGVLAVVMMMGRRVLDLLAALPMITVGVF